MHVPLLKRFSRLLRGQFRARLMGRYGIAVLAATRNGYLAVDPADFTISRKLLQQGSYDFTEIDYLASLMRPSSRLIVVGAHIGAVLIPLVRLSRVAHALAFEPSPKNLRLLRANLMLNGVSERVELRDVALGASSCTLGFIHNPINTGNSRISRSGTDIKVNVVALDRVLSREWAIGAIDLMVVDVEGFEVEVLRGARATLDRTRYLYIEFAPDQLEEQGASVAEFADLIGAHFTQGIAFGRDGVQLMRGDLARWIKTYPRKRSLLLNLLLNR